MRQCYVDEAADVPATEQDYLSELPSRFTVQATLFSRRPRVGGMTIVTSGAANRLFMLDTICATWVGPLAVAILLPVLAFDPSAKPGDGADGRVKGSSSDADVGRVVSEVRATFARAEASAAGCQLDIMVITELVADDLMLATYPISAARNMAMLLARTELVLPMDIDFLLSRDFSDIVLDPDRYAELRNLALARRVIVTPACRTEDEQLAQTVTAGGRPAALEAFANGTIERFNGRAGHVLTDFERWQSTNASYEIIYQDEFEPWCILARLQAPWFDNRFRGRMKNKVNWFRVLNFTGFEFTVHRDAYIVHRPHDENEGMKQGNMRNLWMHNNRWHDDSNQRLRNYTYTAPVTPGVKQCQAQLPWWQM